MINLIDCNSLKIEAGLRMEENESAKRINAHDENESPTAVT